MYVYESATALWLAQCVQPVYERERETAESCTIATLSVSIHPLRLLSMILSLYLWIALHFKDIYSDAHKWT